MAGPRHLCRRILSAVQRWRSVRTRMRALSLNGALRILHRGDLNLAGKFRTKNGWSRLSGWVSSPSLLALRQSAATGGGWLNPWTVMVGVYCLTDTDQTILNGTRKPAIGGLTCVFFSFVRVLASGVRSRFKTRACADKKAQSAMVNSERLLLAT